MHISFTLIIATLGIAYGVNAASILSKREDFCKGGAGAAGLYPVAGVDKDYIQCTSDPGPGVIGTCPGTSVFKPHLRRCQKP